MSGTAPGCVAQLYAGAAILSMNDECRHEPDCISLEWLLGKPEKVTAVVNCSLTQRGLTTYFC